MTEQTLTQPTTTSQTNSVDPVGTPHQPIPDEEQADDVVDTTNTFIIRTAREIETLDIKEEDEYLENAMLTGGSLTNFIGPSGVGKSRLAVQLAASLITGKDFLKFKVLRQAKAVVVVQMENGKKRVKTDVRAIGNSVDPENKELIGLNLYITDNNGYIDMSVPPELNPLAQRIQEINPDVVLFDPLNYFSTGDLNNDKNMRTTIEQIQGVALYGNPNRAIMIVHHSLNGNAGVKKMFGLDRTSYGKNSKLLHARARAQFNICSGSADNNDTLIIGCGKCSEDSDFDPFAITLNHETLIYEVDEEFDLQGWINEIQGEKEKKLKASNGDVIQILSGEENSLKRKDLVQSLMDETGCSKTLAYNAVKAALAGEHIKYDKETKLYSI